MSADDGASMSSSRGVWSARMRWVALGAFATTAILSFVVQQGHGRGHELTESDIPALLVGAVLGLATTVVAAFGFRGTGLRIRIGLILIGLCALGAAGWDLFVAWMIAIFPKC